MSITRNYSLFPNDENGDVLWRMYSSGDDLSRPREIDFSVIFPAKDLAMDFALVMLTNGFKVSASSYDKAGENSWQVGVHPVLKPTHRAITEFETMLEREAQLFEGTNDGWGCFEQSQ